MDKVISTELEITVPFYDVDAMQVAWHGHYVKYMEEARCQLLDLIDYNYYQMQASGYFWPIVDMRIKYIKPLTFKQKIIVKATLADIDYGLKIDFLFTDKNSGKKLTTAYTKQVAVNQETEEMCLLTPDILEQKIMHHQKS